MRAERIGASMGVAHLAQSVGEAVDADSLLLRIGGYYRDIGKMVSPSDYIENQFNSPNPHNSLSPLESTQRIFRHVTDGVRLAAEYRLPKMVVDLIPQHHGTLLLEYFYTKAAKAEPKTEVRKRDFRYPGPKPQSREAAILMVADAVEAASRTLEQPNRHTFDRLVRLIIVKRIADGQFSECDLDTIQIEKITDALVERVRGHVSWPYPLPVAAGGETIEGPHNSSIIAFQFDSDSCITELNGPKNPTVCMRTPDSPAVLAERHSLR